MTEHIKKINIKIKEYYEYIKLSWKNQDNFNFENFIQEIKIKIIIAIMKKHLKNFSKLLNQT